MLITGFPSEATWRLSTLNSYCFCRVRDGKHINYAPYSSCRLSWWVVYLCFFTTGRKRDSSSQLQWSCSRFFTDKVRDKDRTNLLIYTYLETFCFVVGNGLFVFFYQGQSFEDTCSSQITEASNALILALHVSTYVSLYIYICVRVSRSLLRNSIHRHVKMFVCISCFESVTLGSDDASYLYLLSCLWEFSMSLF